MKFRILPPVFKIIGLAIILLTLIILRILKLSDKTVLDGLFTDKATFSRLAASVFFTGFLLFILAREKIEDEFADFCRLTAFRLAFLFGLISIILNPIRLFHYNNLESSSLLLLIQCIFYIIIFYAGKKGLIRYEK